MTKALYEAERHRRVRLQAAAAGQDYAGAARWLDGETGNDWGAVLGRTWPNQHDREESAARAGVATDTVVRFENGDGLHQRTGIAIREAFEDAGVVFIDENGGGPASNSERLW